MTCPPRSIMLTRRWRESAFREHFGETTLPTRHSIRSLWSPFLNRDELRSRIQSIDLSTDDSQPFLSKQVNRFRVGLTFFNENSLGKHFGRVIVENRNDSLEDNRPLIVGIVCKVNRAAA